MQKKLIIISILSAVLFFTGCEPHRIDIQQGNKVKPENFEKLKIGMTRNQVIYILGSPLLVDSFHQDRWDYIYYLKPGNKAVLQSRLTLYFNGDSLSKIDDSEYTPNVHDNSSMGHTTGEPDVAPAAGGGGGHSH